MPLASKQPSAGEREGMPLASKQPSAGEREGMPLSQEGAEKCPTAGAFGFGFSLARGSPSRSPAKGSGPAPLVDHATSVPGRWRSPDTFVPW